MRLPGRLSMSKKLAWQAASIGILFIALLVYIQLGLGRMSQNAAYTERAAELASQTGTMWANFYDLDGALNMYLLVMSNPDLRRSTYHRYQSASAAFVQALGRAKALSTTADETRLLYRIQTNYEDYQTYETKMQAALQARKLPLAVYLQAVANSPITNNLDRNLDRLGAIAMTRMAASARADHQREEDITLSMAVAGTAVLLLMLGLMIWLENYYLGIARVDSLTGIFNRGHLLQAFESSLAMARKFNRSVSIIMIDIDDFKVVNDELGHLEGDALLREMAEVIKGQTREGDIAARYGGDEFAVVVSDSTLGLGAILADRIQKAVATCPFAVGAVIPGGRATVSVGVATYPVDGADAITLLRVADERMYADKNSHNPGRPALPPDVATSEGGPAETRN